MGIKTPWTISDDPEFIGSAKKDWQFQTISATADTQPESEKTVGDPAGYFKSNHACRIKPTFSPEHGLIVMVGVARMDMPNTLGQGHPVCKKFGAGSGTRRRFYSPEFETIRIADQSDLLFGEDNPAENTVQTPMYEDYRKASNMYGEPTTVTNPDLLYFATYDNPLAMPQDYRTLPMENFNNLFTGNMGGEAAVHYSIQNEVRMLKKSPIKPPQQIKGVS